jgi:3-deoxy-D-manno-octulosonic-acid transferase
MMIMQRIWQFLYSWIAYPVMWLGVHALALKNQNLKDGLAGRKGLWERLGTQLRQRDPKKPLIWFHVSSAGEFLQARPVLERCLQRGFDCALTFTSVNGYKWIQRTKFPNGQRPVATEYLPLDSLWNMRRIIKALHPVAIVYVKYDLWPNLVWEAHAAGISQYLISATLQPRSKRLISVLGRSLYRTLYACLNGIFAVTDDDRQRFLSTNPDHPNILTVGDTRFDSVLDRKKRLLPPKIPDSIQGKFVFIAGSSWPPDEACIFPALKEALERYPDFFSIIVPHEPTEEHLQNSETFFKDFPLERLTQLNQQPVKPSRIILGDTVGVLSSLYAVGTLAYVGGAFTTGVHNVIEPCAMGLPVIFGPKHYNSPEAVDFLKRGLAFTVNNTADFRTVLFRLLEEPERCRQLGQQAAQVIASRAGVAERCFELITKNMNIIEH